MLYWFEAFKLKFLGFFVLEWTEMEYITMLENENLSIS